MWGKCLNVLFFLILDLLAAKDKVPQYTNGVCAFLMYTRL